MPGRVGLARDRSLLQPIGFGEAMLTNPHPGDQIQRFNLMHIEPARVAQFLCRLVCVAGFRIKPAQSEGRAVVPPMIPGKIRDQSERPFGTFGLAE